HAVPGEDLDEDFNNLRTRENDYMQDRAAMKDGNFTGIKGIPNQDVAMWVSMGAITDRTKEVLGASDLAIVEMRRLMVEAAGRMRDENIALGVTLPHVPHAGISSWQGIVPKTTDWRMLGVSEEEIKVTAGEAGKAAS
ncbi:MAG: MarR family transcriptional regulator, partial [Alphaproteobacteria bacterium]|nr:MarR family transcriptional regulator [Alphaproteobacteria bacterium]